MGTHYATDGTPFYVDDADDGFVRCHKWSTTTCGDRKRAAYIRSTARGHKLLHRLLLSAPKGVAIDHADGDTFNNRRSNLRFATLSQNAHNQRRSRNNTSGCKGVTWHKRDRKWQVALKLNYKTHYRGYFATFDAAVAAYAQAAHELHGEFARIGDLAAAQECQRNKHTEAP